MMPNSETWEIKVKQIIANKSLDQWMEIQTAHLMALPPPPPHVFFSGVDQ